MAEQRVVGNDGNITMPTATSNAVIGRWRGNFPKVASETTGFEDSNIRRNRLGMTSFEGSASGVPRFNATTTDPGVGDRPVAGSSTVLTVATGCSYTMDLAMQNIGHDTNKIGESTITFDMVNGDADTLTIVWDETA